MVTDVKSPENFAKYLVGFRGLRPGTARRYASEITTWLESGRELTSWLQLSVPSAFNVRVAAVRAWHKYHGWRLPDLPTHRIQQVPPRYASPEAVLAMMDFIGERFGPRERMAGLLLYCAGLRIGELQELRLDDVNIEARLLRVLGKGGKVRNVPMLQALVEPLRIWLSDGRSRYVVDGSKTYLMLSNRGARYDERKVLEAIHAAWDELGLGDMHTKPAHWIRHMCASHMYEGGMPLVDLQVFLGHDDVRTTEKYIHTTAARLGRIVRDAHPLGKVDEPLPGVQLNILPKIA